MEWTKVLLLSDFKIRIIKGVTNPDLLSCRFYWHRHHNFSIAENLRILVLTTSTFITVN